MKLIVGLGNPGENYSKNRHNVGFMVAEKLAKQILKSQILKFSNNEKFKAEMIQEKGLILAKPQTFMNESGRAVASICRFYKIENSDLYIAHDDLDIALGSYKIQHGKGPQVHNGLLSIEQTLGTDQFWNVRVGVENREVRGNKGVPGVVYSLQDFLSEERKIVGEVIGRVVEDLLTRLG
ncbi:MAG: aminoacyl-tRNA hydrolase [bacterium]